MPSFMLRKFIVYGLLLLGTQFSSLGQGYQIMLHGASQDSLSKIFNFSSSCTDIPACEETLRSIKSQCIQQGYLAASIDSFTVIDTQLIAHIFLGDKYTWAELRNINIPTSLFQLARIDEDDFLGQVVKAEKLFPYYEKIIRYCEENGFPFASISLDSVISQQGKLRAGLILNKGPYVKIDSIVFNEDAKISRNYMLHYLGLKQGMSYQESKVKIISKKINELPFISEAYPWKMVFTSAKNTLNIAVKNKSANRADILIGLQPTNAETGGKFLLTGDVKMAFVNALGQGESLSLNWQNLQYKSPRYNLLIQYPYLLNSPIGLSAKFDFYKKDTTFKTVNGELGLIYQLNANDQLKVYYEIASNRLNSINTAQLKSTRKLPDNADVNYRTVGFETLFSRVDYKLNPRKGFRTLLNIGVSFRTFIRNTQVEQTIDPILNIPFTYLYDSLGKKSYKYTLRGELAYFIPLAKRVVFSTQYKGGYTFSTNPLFKNELFQIGGFRLLRGFDEGSIFVNQYHILTLEPRYLLSQNSYFFLFSDLGVIQSKFANTFIRDKPYSLGLGMTFETKAGLFNISYGLGARDDQSFKFRNAKIHFGYINYF